MWKKSIPTPLNVAFVTIKQIVIKTLKYTCSHVKSINPFRPSLSLASGLIGTGAGTVVLTALGPPPEEGFVVGEEESSGSKDNPTLSSSSLSLFIPRCAAPVSGLSKNTSRKAKESVRP